MYLDVDYVELAQLDGQVAPAAAVHVGKTRLIDNIVIEGENISTPPPRQIGPYPSSAR